MRPSQPQGVQSSCHSSPRPLPRKKLHKQSGWASEFSIYIVRCSSRSRLGFISTPPRFGDADDGLQRCLADSQLSSCWRRQVLPGWQIALSVVLLLWVTSVHTPAARQKATHQLHNANHRPSRIYASGRYPSIGACATCLHDTGGTRSRRWNQGGRVPASVRRPRLPARSGG